MAATVTIRRYTGTSGSPTLNDVTATTTIFNSSDNHYTSATVNPVVIPTSSSNYSYWQAFRLSADTTPATSISNLKVYTDGANSSPSGVTWVGNTATSYVQATGTSGTTGIILNTSNYATLAAAAADIFTWTSGSPKSVTGSISNPSTGAFGDWVVVQMVVASSVTSTGTTTAEALSFVYDET
jgi:hypothetical protein